jgi:hypothetical protein
LVVPPTQATIPGSTAHAAPLTTCRRDKPANLIFIIVRADRYIAAAS